MFVSEDEFNNFWKEMDEVKTYWNSTTGVVVELTAKEHDRFFDNRDPFEWTLIKEKTND